MASFTFAAGNATKLLRLPLYALGAAASLVVPRNPRLWVFGSGTGPGEGALPLYHAARARLPADVRLVWLASTDAELAGARDLGLDVERKRGWRGFRLTLRARVAVVTHGFGDVNRYGTRGALTVQLWHGIPLKKLHLDSPATLRLPLLPDHPLVRNVMRRAYRFAGRGIGLFPVASELVAERIRSAFGVRPERVVVTGDPRDDALLTGSADERTQTARDRIARAVGPLPEGAQLVLYAPTWRDGAADPGAPTPDEWTAIAAWAERSNAVLLVRAHPLGAGDYARGPAVSHRVRLLSPALLPEITPALAAIDGLVTDYSSIAYDYALVGGRIVFFAPDVELYAQSRGLYQNYRDVTGGAYVTTWQNVLDRLDAPADAARVRWLRDEHVDRLDGRATERVLAELLRRVDVPGADAHGIDEGAPATPRPVVTAIAFHGDRLSVRVKPGDSAWTGGTLSLEGARSRVVGSEGSFRLLAERWGSEPLALPSGEYWLGIAAARAGSITAEGAAAPISTRVHVEAELPDELRHPLFRASVHARAGGLVLRIEPPLEDDERGAAAQKRLERAYRRDRRPLEDAVFLESFYGQSTADNPGGIADALAATRPGTRRYWSVIDRSVPVPSGASALVEGSREWWQARATARVLIVNDWLRKRYRRHRDQHVLQTWHGTMLKRLALDRARSGIRGLRTRLAVQRERRRWDALLAQNAYSAEIFRSAYAMPGPIWQTGYPRNDIFASPDRAATVRTLLGIPAGARVVLYAPTWRDDRTEMVDYVDLARFADELGPGHVLLVRGHSRTLRYGQDVVGERLLDVTSYPSMADLLLVADVLVTDYSSSMFDFAATGKPMVFFTPDLAHYSEDLRGFYFDLLAEAPGPVVATREELHVALAAAERGAPDYAARRAEWRERFTPLDDGQAGARVVERLIAEGWLPARE
ncbi:CDP-glycerol glycerophosphotransferase family protein [Pseudolysinimonas kribbensis]|uniref:CDP-glycerol glycerophosphotransferase family protein n=1 Tax=Pseudolysinimonas kribbensis TaxID=433641 RepID=UPI0031DF965C